MMPRRCSSFGRIQESVGGDQVDARMVFPAGEQCLQHAGGGGLADRDRSGDTDDEGHLRSGCFSPRKVAVAANSRCRAATCRWIRRARGRYTSATSARSICSPRPRSPMQFVLGEHERRRLTQCAPLLAVELDVGAGFAQACHRHHPSTTGDSSASVPRSGQRRCMSMERIVLADTARCLVGVLSWVPDRLRRTSD